MDWVEDLHPQPHDENIEVLEWEVVSPLFNGPSTFEIIEDDVADGISTLDQVDNTTHRTKSQRAAIRPSRTRLRNQRKQRAKRARGKNHHDHNDLIESDNCPTDPDVVYALSADAPTRDGTTLSETLCQPCG